MTSAITSVIRLYHNGGLVEVPDVGSVLARFLAQHHRLRIDEAEAVDNHFPLDALDGVNHHCHGPRVELLKTL